MTLGFLNSQVVDINCPSYNCHKFTSCHVDILFPQESEGKRFIESF